MHFCASEKYNNAIAIFSFNKILLKGVQFNSKSRDATALF